MTTQGPDDRRLVSARLLIELVNTHLDPGYAAAARHRPPDAPPRWYDRPAVIAGCLLIGFVLVVGYIHTHRGAPAAARLHASLVSRVRSAQQEGRELSSELADLQAKLTQLQKRALPPSADVTKKLNREQLLAGQLEVSGPGLTVMLGEPAAPSVTPSAGRGGTIPIGATNILTDRDVRSVVNELWRDGAEAIAVNGIRLTPTSAIGFAGEAVLVDFEPITAPYEIVAIGNADLLATNFAESAVASRYQTLAGAEHIDFSFADAQHLTVPAGTPVKPKYATVARKRAPR